MNHMFFKKGREEGHTTWHISRHAGCDVCGSLAGSIVIHFRIPGLPSSLALLFCSIPSLELLKPGDDLVPVWTFGHVAP